MRVFEVTKDQHLAQAKKLHASVYLENGYIGREHINNNGLMTKKHDPYQNHSTYFAVLEKHGREERVIATARQIEPKGRKGHASFPTIEKLELEPNVERAIHALNPADCVEISGLAKQTGYSSYASFLLYRAMWQHSLREKHQLWLMAADVRVFNNLKFLFGDALVQIGEKTHYMGSYVVPAALEVDRSLDVFIRNSRSFNPGLRLLHREYIRFFLEGLPAKYLKPRQLSDLRLSKLEGIQKEEDVEEPV
jgi:hypothetical protein